MNGESGVTHKRYLSHQPLRYVQYIQAAKDYFDKVEPAEQVYLYRKPFDLTDYNTQYYLDMFNVLSLLQAMRVRPGGRILDVGCGAGWVTEILVALGYTVDALEPCEDFAIVAEERVQSFHRHYRLPEPLRLTVHRVTLEECTLPDAAFDGILFYAALHHLVDEVQGLAQCFRLLKPGGILGIHEAAWLPGDPDMEAAIEAEMKQFGTLENPFTREYLNHLLDTLGFVQIERYHQVNGLFSTTEEHKNLREIAQSLAEGQNILTAVKLSPGTLTTKNPDARTQGDIQIEAAMASAWAGQLRVKLSLCNTGETLWLNKPASKGWVSVALYGVKKKQTRIELGRAYIPNILFPGETVRFEAVFTLPTHIPIETLRIDLVNEGYFWFSERGGKAATISVS